MHFRRSDLTVNFVRHMRTAIADDWRRFRLRLVSPIFATLEDLEHRAATMLDELPADTPAAEAVQEVLDGVQAAIARRMARQPSRVSLDLIRAWQGRLDDNAPTQAHTGWIPADVAIRMYSRRWDAIHPDDPLFPWAVRKRLSRAVEAGHLIREGHHRAARYDAAVFCEWLNAEMDRALERLDRE